MRAARAWISAAICTLAVSAALPAAVAAHGGEPEPPPPMGSDAGKQSPDKMERGHGEGKSEAKSEPMRGMQEQGGDHGAGKEMAAEEAEEAALARWPSRVLAQQALALHRIRGDAHEAESRIHAALASKDQAYVDTHLLRHAHVALDKGNVSRGVNLLDRALSRPLGTDTGKMLHMAGRELPSGQDTQDIVGMVVGGILILIAGGALLRGRRRPAAAGL